MELDHTNTVTSKFQFLLMLHSDMSLKWSTRDGGVYDRHRDGSAEYYAPDGTVRHYTPLYYSDEDRSDGDYSSESPEETDSETGAYRRMGPGRGLRPLDNRGAAHIPDSESPSEGGVPGSESETETDDYSDRYVPEDYESGSGYDRDDRDSYGDSYDGWDDYDDDDYGDYDGMLALLIMYLPHSFSQTATPPIIITEPGVWFSAANLISLGDLRSCPKKPSIVYICFLYFYQLAPLTHEFRGVSE
jgi:hypothetical protein